MLAETLIKHDPGARIVRGRELRGRMLGALPQSQPLVGDELKGAIAQAIEKIARGGLVEGGPGPTRRGLAMAERAGIHGDGWRSGHPAPHPTHRPGAAADRPEHPDLTTSRKVSAKPDSALAAPRYLLPKIILPELRLGNRK